MLSCRRDVIKTHCCIATTQCWLNQNSERVCHPDCFARGLDTLMIPLFCNSYIILISILYPSCLSEKKKNDLKLVCIMDPSNYMLYYVNRHLVSAIKFFKGKTLSR